MADPNAAPAPRQYPRLYPQHAEVYREDTRSIWNRNPQFLEQVRTSTPCKVELGMEDLLAANENVLLDLFAAVHSNPSPLDLVVNLVTMDDEDGLRPPSENEENTVMRPFLNFIRNKPVRSVYVEYAGAS